MLPRFRIKLTQCCEDSEFNFSSSPGLQGRPRLSRVRRCSSLCSFQARSRRPMWTSPLSQCRSGQSMCSLHLRQSWAIIVPSFRFDLCPLSKFAPRHPNMALLTTKTCERKSCRLFRSRLNLGKVAAWRFRWYVKDQVYSRRTHLQQGRWSRRRARSVALSWRWSTWSRLGCPRCRKRSPPCTRRGWPRSKWAGDTSRRPGSHSWPRETHSTFLLVSNNHF